MEEFLMLDRIKPTPGARRAGLATAAVLGLGAALLPSTASAAATPQAVRPFDGWCGEIPTTDDGEPAYFTADNVNIRVGPSTSCDVWYDQDTTSDSVYVHCLTTDSAGNTWFWLTDDHNGLTIGGWAIGWYIDLAYPDGYVASC
jgi:hypothetical protein